jgi:hypothetical protein
MAKTPGKGDHNRRDKNRDTARQDHKHNDDGDSYQDGQYIVVECTCGAVKSRTWNPSGAE